MVSLVQAECESTVIMCSSEFDLTRRGWVLQGIDSFLMSGKDVCLACPVGVIACSKPFVGGCWVLGRFDTKIAEWFHAVKVEQLETQRESDRETIYDSIAKSKDPEVRQMMFAQFENRLA